MSKEKLDSLDYAKYLLEAAESVASNDKNSYSNSAIRELVTHNNLPEGTFLVPTELSEEFVTDSQLFNYSPLIKSVFEDFVSHEEKQQLLFPIRLRNGHVTFLYATKDENGKAHATYFDPIGIDTPNGTPDPKNQADALKYSSLPDHILECLENDLKISRNEIAITSNKIQGTFFDDENIRHTYSGNGATHTVKYLTEIAKGNVRANIGLDGIARLEQKDQDGNFHDIGDIDAAESEKQANKNRVSDLKQLKSIFENRFPQDSRLEEVKSLKIKKLDSKKSHNNSNQGPSVLGLAKAGLVAAGLYLSGSVTSVGAAPNNQLNLRGSDILPPPPPHSGINPYADNPRPDTTSPTQNPTRKPTAPTSQPTNHPSGQPTRHPSSQPTTQPSRQPTRSPSAEPSMQPTALPSGQPSGKPSLSPTSLNNEQLSKLNRQLVSFISGAVTSVGSTLVLEGLASCLDGSYTSALYHLWDHHPIFATVTTLGFIGTSSAFGALAGSTIERDNPEKTSAKLPESLDSFNDITTSLDFGDKKYYTREGAVDATIAATTLALTTLLTAALVVSCCGAKDERNRGTTIYPGNNIYTTSADRYHAQIKNKPRGGSGCTIS